MHTYFKQILELHRAKIDCICTLSKGTDIDEKVDFVAYDLSREVERAVDRFSEHPEEEEENLPFINRLIFGKLQKIDKPCDVLLVLGSTNCDYRVERALEAGKTYPGVKYASPAQESTSKPASRASSGRAWTRTAIGIS